MNHRIETASIILEWNDTMPSDIIKEDWELVVQTFKNSINRVGEIKKKEK